MKYTNIEKKVAGLLMLTIVTLLNQNCSPAFLAKDLGPNSTEESELNSSNPSTTTQLPPLPASGKASFNINGTIKTGSFLDNIVTRSGGWVLEDLGVVDDSRAYAWYLRENPDFFRIMICRRPFTKEAGDGADLSLKEINIIALFKDQRFDWKLAVAQGSCRIMQNIEPVTPKVAWLREAVAQYRTPSYNRSRAYFPDLLPKLEPESNRGVYDPASLGNAPGSNTAPTSAANYVGTTSGQGGEYTSSRGFIHNIDARVIDAALNNEDALISAIWPQFVQYTYYSLSHPQGAVWSSTQHVTVDPQFPQPGEKPWEMAYWASQVDAADSLIEVTNWGRDDSHMENTGFVHWILTEDPIAGLLLQRQAAYVLGNFYYGHRAGLNNYGFGLLQERQIYNTLAVLWKSRDVSRRVKSQNGTVFWTSTRAEAQAAAAFDWYQKRLLDTAFNATPSASTDYFRKITHAGFSLAVVEQFEMADTSKVPLVMISDFMLPQYGKEPLYLWTKDGNPTARAWLTEAVEHLRARLYLLGGKAGVDGCTGVRGSSIPLGFDGSMPAHKNTTEWVNWLISICPSSSSRTSYDNASVHTTMQLEGLLLLARDAGIPNVDPILNQMAIHRAATKSFRYLDLQWHKHLGASR